MSFLRCERKNVEAGIALLLLVVLPLSTVQAQSTKRGVPQRSDTDRRDELRSHLLSLDLPARTLPSLSAAVVVQKMMATSARRSGELRGFRVTRNYRLQYHGFLGTREAGMKVISTYTAPDHLTFSVVSEYGSKLLLNRVLMKLLDSERDAFRDQSQIELSPQNYQFRSEGIERSSDDDPCYVLGVSPRKENRFLYRGKVWIDAYDFALAKLDGQPAKSPSFWIKDTQIDSNWQKVGGFWLIQHTQSVSHIRLGGIATLTIDYSDYQITNSGPSQGHGQSPQLPNPSSVTPQR